MFVKTSQKNNNGYYQLIHQKNMIEQHYDFFDCNVLIIKGKFARLKCIGRYNQTGTEYIYKINYTWGKKPSVTVDYPMLDYNSDVHVYKDKSLCLYYPDDFKWNKEQFIYNTIIPWTHEWFVYYEIYQITGRWEHPEVKHTTEEK